MPRRRACWPWLSPGCLVGCGLFLAAFAGSASNEPVPTLAPGQAALVAVEGDKGGVTFTQTPHTQPPAVAVAGQVFLPGTRVRTRAYVRATLRLSDRTLVNLAELTTFDLEPPPETATSPLVRLWEGVLHFISRDQPMNVRFATEQAIGGTRGTEFVLAAQDGRTRVAVLEGSAVVQAGDDGRATEVAVGREAVVHDGQIELVPLNLDRVVQWRLYYPVVLDLAEVPESDALRRTYAASVAAYQRGDLRAALESYLAQNPPPKPLDPAERLYRSALVLSVGHVEEAQELLLGQEPTRSADPARWISLKRALQRLIDVVRATPESNPGTDEPFDPCRPPTPGAHTESPSPAPLPRTVPATASEWLSWSYAFQSRVTDLERARCAAAQAVARSPNFAAAAARLAELEFSTGDTPAARRHIAASLVLAPDSAPARVLHGFLLAASYRPSEARREFERAVELDAGLPTAWLGRGLMRIRGGAAEAGLQDLQTAVAVDPGQALLRSYVGKAYLDGGRDALGRKELDRAVQLDPEDPTPWLYSAIGRFERNRVNEAVRDVETSLVDNENRQIYRSGLLLDMDRATRGASLARIYEAAGLREFSLAEATRAVANDYANYSTRLFLADTYDAYRDPSRFNLRYETVWFNELLLANLLAPAGAGAFSPNLGQQEYSRLFESRGVGLDLTTLVRSDDDLRQWATHWGRFNRFDYSLDLDYQERSGVGANNDLRRLEWYGQFKLQLTPADHLFLINKYQEFEAGDNFQYYDPERDRKTSYRFQDTEDPLLAVGYDHLWRPGFHTLVLGGILRATQFAEQDAFVYPRFGTNAPGQVDQILFVPLDYQQDSRFEIGTAELQQIVQGENYLAVLGGRAQRGTFHAASLVTNVPPLYRRGWHDPAAETAISEPLERLSLYAYTTVEPWQRVWLTAGLTYDDLVAPENWRHPPVSPGTSTTRHWGPKAGAVWEAFPSLTLRAAYSRSMAGVTLDESFRLEPAQIAGFPHAFRTVISESLVGSVAAPEYDVAGFAADYHTNDWYLTASVNRIGSQVERTEGSFWGSTRFLSTPTTVGQHDVVIDYKELSAQFTASRLLGAHWSAGAGIEYTQSDYREVVRAAFGPSVTASDVLTERRADLWRPLGFATFHHPSGFFARANVSWTTQSLGGQDAPGPGDQFPMVDWEAGYRFRQRRAEFALGMLNATDTDYRLDPVTPHQEMPHERVVYLRVRLNF